MTDRDLNRWVLLSLGCGRPQYQVTEFQRSQEGAARLAAARGGLELRVAVAQNDPTVQKAQIMEAVNAPKADRPVAVVVHAAALVGYERVAQAALSAGVGWVLVDSSIPPSLLRANYPGCLLSSASPDSVEVGRLSASLALALLPDGGSVVVIEGPSTTAVAIQRRRGLLEGLRDSKLRILQTLVADWKIAGAEKATHAWLDAAGDVATRPDLVISQNDEMAEGVLRALRVKRPSWGKVAAIGLDGLPDYGQRLVNEGVLSATIVAPSSTGPGVDLVVRWLAGEKVTPVTIPVHPYPSLLELAPLQRG